MRVVNYVKAWKTTSGTLPGLFNYDPWGFGSLPGGHPKSWMVCNGKSTKSGWELGVRPCSHKICLLYWARVHTQRPTICLLTLWNGRAILPFQHEFQAPYPLQHFHNCTLLHFYTTSVTDDLMMIFFQSCAQRFIPVFPMRVMLRELIRAFGLNSPDSDPTKKAHS